MPLFVVYSYAKMDDENALFGNMIIDNPVVGSITTERDLRDIEGQIQLRFGMPENYRWLTLHDWKWIPPDLSGTINAIADSLEKKASRLHG